MLPSTVNLHSFIAVTQTGQFKLAAQELNLTESAISHQISRLEQQLKTQLFERSRTGVKLTEAGQAFHHHIALGLNEIRNGVEAVTIEQENIVAISAPRTFAAMWLAPRISAFSGAFPDIDLQITATDRICDFRRNKIDIAFRVSNADWPDCEKILFCRQELTPVANAELAEKIKLIGWKETLREMPFILNQTHPQEWIEWSKQTGANIPDQPKFRQLESYDLVQAAAIRGFGIALARSPLESEAYSDRKLFKVRADKIGQDAPYHMVWSKNRKMNKPTRIFVDWIGQLQGLPK